MIQLDRVRKLEPEADGGDEHHRQIVGGALLVTPRHTLVLLKPIEEARITAALAVGRVAERAKTQLVRASEDAGLHAVFAALVAQTVVPEPWSPTSASGRRRGAPRGGARETLQPAIRVGTLASRTAGQPAVQRRGGALRSSPLLQQNLSVIFRLIRA